MRSWLLRGLHWGWQGHVCGAPVLFVGVRGHKAMGAFFTSRFFFLTFSISGWCSSSRPPICFARWWCGSGGLPDHQVRRPCQPGGLRGRTRVRWLGQVCQGQLGPQVPGRKSRKLAVASWSCSCFRKGRGRSESTDFHSSGSCVKDPVSPGWSSPLWPFSGSFAQVRSCQLGSLWCRCLASQGAVLLQCWTRVSN